MKKLIKSKNTKIWKCLSFLLAHIVLLYPFIVYFGTKVLPIHSLYILIILFLTGGLILQIKKSRRILSVATLLVAILLCVSSAFSGNQRFVLYFPLLFTMTLLFSFSYTLFYPPSMIEVFARMIIPERSREEVEYCRRVTLMWVVFFIFNGIAASYTACCTSLAIWSLYNGLISYLIIGLLFTAELCYRYWRFRRYAGLRTDFIFRRLFPPRG